MHEQSTCFVQVSLPSLHITLGVFQRLFELLELDCHKLDLQLAHSSEAVSSCTASYQKYLDAKRKAMSVQEKMEQHKNELKNTEQLATYLALIMNTTATDSRLAVVHSRAAELKDKITSLVSHQYFFL